MWCDESSGGLLIALQLAERCADALVTQWQVNRRLRHDWASSFNFKFELWQTQVETLHW